MKLYFFTFGAHIADDVETALEAEGFLDAYTEFPRVLGVGQTSGPHLGTPVWPKVNKALLLGVADDQGPVLEQVVRELKQRFAAEGVQLFAWQGAQVVV
ncbi:MAG: hypothetical protein KJ621_08300 [Proteobacteria bacterium]|nr:hypothetical protein [Pseudomonadota bacterium]MBU1741383.1 hypothetical protein [Pseudomonadota bacterium]